MPSSWAIRRERFAPWLAFAGALLLGLAAYGPALRGGAVWDDAAHLTRADLRSWAGLARIWTELGATQQYYPVLHSAFWLEQRLWGDAVAGYHLVNVLLHALSCGLLVALLRRLRASLDDPRRLPAGTEWLAAAVFAVHPVMVESVAWISEQKNTLSLVFYLLAGGAYLKFEASRRGRDYAVASLWFMLALGTKSVTASLPAALLVVRWWRDGALAWRRDLRPLMPWFAAALAAGLFTAWMERQFIGARGGAFELGGLPRTLLAGRIVWFYLGKLLWPAGLVFVYPRWDVVADSTRWWPLLLGAVGMTGGLWWLRRRMRGPLAGWLFFVGSLFPALGFFNVYPFLFSYVADHFQYLASLGVIVTLAAVVAATVGSAPGPVRLAGVAAAVLVVVGLATLSRRQSAEYRDSETLYRATLAANPACWMAHNNLAVALAERPGGAAEARTHYEAALALHPGYAEAHNNFGNLLARQPGREDEAETHFRRALALEPDFIEAQLNLANLLARRVDGGARAEALALFARAAALQPGAPAVEVCWADALAREPGREAEARAHYREALRLDAGLARAHLGLALLADHPGGEAEAEAEYRAALKRDPSLAVAHNNLGILCAQQQRWAEAGAEWKEALRLAPDYADARRNLERLRAMQPAPDRPAGR